jgi:hypothetical protein
MATGHAGPHAGGAHVGHHRSAQGVDLFKQRVVAAVVDREVLHDRVEVKAHEAELIDGVPGLADGDLTLGGLDGAPALDDPGAVALPEAVHVVIGAGGRGHGGLQVQGHHAGLDAGSGELGHNLPFGLGDPVAFPVGGQGLGVRAL